MKIILSPAKKMKEEDGLLPWSTPVFQTEAQQILDALSALAPDERMHVWNCSAKLAAENERRLSRMDLNHGNSPALFSYSGLAYNYLTADALTDANLHYLQDHLRILSALYGVLRPMDGIATYRLEFAAPLSVSGAKDLYAFWNNRIAEEVMKNEDVVVNLASKEYSDAIEPYLNGRQQMIHIIFLHEKNGSYVTKGTLAKMARGSMVRWLAEQEIEDPSEIKTYSDGYCFSKERSDSTHYVFLQKENSCLR